MIRNQTQRDQAQTPLLDSAPMTGPVRQVVDLFREDLAGVTFPDVSLALLEQSVQVVYARTAELEELRGQLSAAQAELSAAREELDKLAERCLAYAKVYATDNADLTEKLSKIGVSEAPKRRRRKVSDPSETESRPQAASEPTSLMEDHRVLHLSVVG